MFTFTARAVVLNVNIIPSIPDVIIHARLRGADGLRPGAIRVGFVPQHAVNRISIPLRGGWNGDALYVCEDSKAPTATSVWPIQNPVLILNGVGGTFVFVAFLVALGTTHLEGTGRNQDIGLAVFRILPWIGHWEGDIEHRVT